MGNALNACAPPNDTSPRRHSSVKRGGSADRLCHIIHFNDVYNMLPSYTEDPVGGMARFSTMVKELKQDLAPAKVLTIFSGDFVGPSLMSTISRGAHFIEAFNTIGVDFGCFGNHEFDYGYESLKRRLAGVEEDLEPGETHRDYPATKTVWLSSNLSEGDTKEPAGGSTFATRKALVDVDGVQVGLLGVAENWLDGCSQLKPGEIVYEDYIECSRRIARELKSEGADVVFAVTHNRLENDRKLTAAVSEIDLLLGGHDHFYKRDRRRRIVKGAEEFRWLNHVQCEIDSMTGEMALRVERYDVDEEVHEDPVMLKLIDAFGELRDTKYKRVIGKSKVILDPTEETSRFKEGLLQNWVCDAIAEDYCEDAGLQNAEICFIMGLHFAGKKPLPAGDISLGDLFRTFPKPLTIEVIKLSGEDVMKSITLGCKPLPRECAGLHHCNHRLSYEIELNKDPKRPHIVKNVLHDGKPIDLKKMYTVAITDAMGQGKFGYDWFGSAERIVSAEHGCSIQDLIHMWCKRHAGSAIDPSFGRIKISE